MLALLLSSAPYAPQLKLAGLFLFTLNHNIPDPPREWAAIAGDIRSTAAFLAYYVNKYWPRPVEHTHECLTV